MLYLDKQAIIGINKQVTSFYGQPHVILAEANLEHFLEQTIHYAKSIEDEGERLFKKAAFLLYHLAFDAHAFADGNKRTALLSTAAFLAMNSYYLSLDGDEKQVEQARIMKETAEGKTSINFLAKWLKENSTKG